jgi:hypothetical protein
MSRTVDPTAEAAKVGAEYRRGLGAAFSAKSSAFSAVKLILALVFLLCFGGLLSIPTSAQESPRDPRYPAHWWTPINDPKKPDWEILPQEAGPGEVILSKRNELGLLSNFAATPFVFHGKRYASLEGFWQAMLYPEGPNDPRAKFPGLEWKYTRQQVTQMTAFEAKHAGDLAEENMRKMKIGWVSFEGKRFAYRPKKTGTSLSSDCRCDLGQG